MNVNQLIIDYIVICDKRGQILELADFVRLWSLANEIAEERARHGELTIEGSSRVEMSTCQT